MSAAEGRVVVSAPEEVAEVEGRTSGAFAISSGSSLRIRIQWGALTVSKLNFKRINPYIPWINRKKTASRVEAITQM